MREPDRAEALLALILLEHLKGSPIREKALRLNLAGFTNSEIADLLDTTSFVVAQSLYTARREKKKKKKK